MANSNLIAVNTEDLCQQCARLMAKTQPGWWPTEADAQHQMEGCLAWMQSQPPGWLLARPDPDYRAVQIETIGSAQGVGPGLEDLVAACENWARENSATHLRFVISSRGLSIDGTGAFTSPGGDSIPPWQALRDLQPIDRPEFHWWLALGFVPSGLYPNAYAPGRHGVVLIKAF